MKNDKLDLICFIIFMVGFIIVGIISLYYSLPSNNTQVCYIKRIDNDLKVICEDKGDN